MPRTALTTALATDVGVERGVPAPDASGQAIIPPNGIMVVRNDSGSAGTVTVVTPPTAIGMPSGIDLPDRVLNVANGENGVIGPFPYAFYARQDAIDKGQVYVNFSPLSGWVAFVVQP